jgi:uncharacterized hydrophobic protein (TIGR00341 family)
VAERVLKIITPQAHADSIRDLLGQEPVTTWQEESDGANAVIGVLADQGRTEALTDTLRQRFGNLDDFHIVVLAVEAAISPQKDAAAPDTRDGDSEHTHILPRRVSRDELYTLVRDDTSYTSIFIVMTALSTVVAAIGLLGDNVAAIIGAMVIAPLLGPHVGLALATTLADGELGRLAAKAFLVAVAVALTLALLTGMLMDVDPLLPQIASRTRIGLSDILLALAAGCAGVFAYTTGVSGAVIGVMVAVALLPPLVVCGLLLGAGRVHYATQALLLFACNVICVNLAGTATFFLQGIRPRTWWQADRARRATRLALLLWSFLLLALLAVILIGN